MGQTILRTIRHPPLPPHQCDRCSRVDWFEERIVFRDRMITSHRGKRASIILDDSICG